MTELRLDSQARLWATRRRPEDDARLATPAAEPLGPGGPIATEPHYLGYMFNQTKTMNTHQAVPDKCQDSPFGSCFYHHVVVVMGIITVTIIIIVVEFNPMGFGVQHGTLMQHKSIFYLACLVY